ncbi:MAG TPA: aconitate hydratase [Methanothrix sp.]|nr:aconitate hydratase [Methanothrix sp.]HPC89649.1 aconitate hydratase [Methanothrix sp.]HQI67978.1 aconitate hydratase [Methanothrix sp.]HRS84936.1 aconitate hydratase [Methanothrix sp.]HRT17165.1 aconitate hydratase [Methanothrix sp.]
MGFTLTEKILREHLAEGSGSYEPGKEIGIKIDQTLTQDATGTMAYLQFESMGLSEIATELSVSYVDHNTIQVGFENADDHAYLETIAKKYGIYFSRPGNGICHQVHLERFARPGRTLLGSDSHTPTAGGVGSLAIGAGGLDVAVAMGGGAYYLTAPKVIDVHLTGDLQPWATAKDVVLKVLSILSTKGNVGCVCEYTGDGIAGLTVPERATITNMGAETGVTTSIFPSDEQTRRFLAAQGRGDQWKPLGPDRDAVYDRSLEIDLSEIQPLAAAPHSPGNIVRINDLDLPVDQVMIGSCTNSSYVDLMTVAAMVKGRRLAAGVSLGIAPGSRQVLSAIARNGALSDLIAFGARILESACGFCIGNSMSPCTNSVSVRTSNRNFKGRSGTPSANVYLTSPVVAAAAAITGRLVDPAELGIPFPGIEMPESFEIDDSMIIPPLPQSARADVKIRRGPNIGEPPVNGPMPEEIAGQVTIRVGDLVTTDHIMPAGSRLKYRSNVPKYSEFVFEPLDRDFSSRAAGLRDQGIHNIIVAGQSYGQGSSREHAALCPMYLGVKAVIAKSIERIHAANLVNFGILPLSFTREADWDALPQGTSIRIPAIREALKSGKESIVALAGEGEEQRSMELQMSLWQRQREILLSGGLLSYTVQASKGMAAK